MSLKSSGLWCDICRRPILNDPYWNCSVNGKPGHLCEKCKTFIEAQNIKPEEKPMTKTNKAEVEMAGKS